MTFFLHIFPPFFCLFPGQTRFRCLLAVQGVHTEFKQLIDLSLRAKKQGGIQNSAFSCRGKVERERPRSRAGTIAARRPRRPAAGTAASAAQCAAG